MERMNRALALEHIRVAARQGDMAKVTRLMIENGISQEAMREATRKGELDMSKSERLAKEQGPANRAAQLASIQAAAARFHQSQGEWHPYGNPNAKGEPGRKSAARAEALRYKNDSADAQLGHIRDK